MPSTSRGETVKPRTRPAASFAMRSNASAGSRSAICSASNRTSYSVPSTCTSTGFTSASAVTVRSKSSSAAPWARRTADRSSTGATGTAPPFGLVQVALPSAHNGTFVLSALENLTGSDALISLRGRGIADRPFELVNQLRREAEVRYLSSEQALTARLGPIASTTKRASGAIK